MRMAKTGSDKEYENSIKDTGEFFFKPELDTDPLQQILELESTVAAQRAALESIRKELNGTREDMEKTLAFSNKMAQAADQAARAKSRFLRNVSHELRTPMNSIIGMTRLIGETELTAEQAEFNQIVEESAKELMCIIDDILDLSKIESNTLIIAHEPFELSTILDDALTVAAFSAREKSLYLDLVCDGVVPTKLKGDGGRVRQVLNNLISNGVKFTEKGRVDVRVTLDSETDDVAVIRFTVQDTGIGIPAGADGLIFESFAMADPSTTRRHGGTGLGLSISREIVKAMGGKIGGRNRKDGGAEFYFSLPFTKQADARAIWDEFYKLAGRRVIVFGPELLSNKTAADMLKEVKAEALVVNDPRTFTAAADNAAQNATPFDFALFATDAGLEVFSMFAGGITTHPAFANTHIIGIHPPGHRPSIFPTQRKMFAVCLERPLRQFVLYRALNSAADGTLPAARQTRPMRQSSPKNPIRVLLVEDHLYSQKLTTQVLTRLGYHVNVAVNGLDALASLRAEIFDLVLMDIQMPVMDGLSAARAIRNPETGAKDPDVPIIALTAHAYDEDKQLCLKAGMNDFILKPVDPKALKNAIDSLLEDEVCL